MKQLDSKAVWLFFFRFALRGFIPLVILDFYLILFSGLSVVKEANDVAFSVADISFEFLKWSWLIIPAILILCFVWAKLTYYFYRYELTDAGFRKESGVISKRYVTIPYDRIQNIDIYRGIPDRLLDLSDLYIQTASQAVMITSHYGSSGISAEGKLPGLSQEVAEQLRDELIQRSHQSRGNQGL